MLPNTMPAAMPPHIPSVMPQLTFHDKMHDVVRQRGPGAAAVQLVDDPVVPFDDRVATSWSGSRGNVRAYAHYAASISASGITIFPRPP